MPEDPQVLSPLDPSFQLAKELKDRAEQRAAQLQLELDAAKARIALLETQLDNTSLRLQEAQAQEELTKMDRDYWHARSQDQQREIAAVDAVVGVLKDITRNALT